MAAKKPKVGDPAIIDGTPCVVARIDAKGIEIHDEQRVTALARVAEIQAMPPDEAAKAKAAFELNPMPTGTAYFGALVRIMWVKYSEAWSLHGRLLSHAQDESGRSVWSRAQVRKRMGEPYDPAHEIAAHIAADMED